MGARVLNHWLGTKNTCQKQCMALNRKYITLSCLLAVVHQLIHPGPSSSVLDPIFPVRSETRYRLPRPSPVWQQWASGYSPSIHMIIRRVFQEATGLMLLKTLYQLNGLAVFRSSGEGRSALLSSMWFPDDGSSSKWHQLYVCYCLCKIYGQHTPHMIVIKSQIPQTTFRHRELKSRTPFLFHF